MAEESLISAELQANNRERLQDILQKPVGFLALDLHGFVLDKNPEINTKNMALLADFVAKGGYFAGITGYGERIFLDFINPFKQMLMEKGVDIAAAPCSFATRNGALIQHLNGEIVHHNPIPMELFDEIVDFPLVRALNSMTTGLVLRDLLQEREENKQAGMALHPQQEDKLWGMRVDYSGQTKECYQITGMWGRWAISERLSYPNTRRIQTVLKYCNNTIPETPDEMADWLRIHFDRVGLDVEIHTAASHKEIDFVMPGTNKGEACNLLAPEVAKYWGCSVEEVPGITVVGGDSPFQNDKALLSYSPHNAITNNASYLSQYSENGPIYLDFPTAQNPVERTTYFLQNMTVLSR